MQKLLQNLAFCCTMAIMAVVFTINPNPVTAQGRDGPTIEAAAAAQAFEACATATQAALKAAQDKALKAALAKGNPPEAWATVKAVVVVNKVLSDTRSNARVRAQQRRLGADIQTIHKMVLELRGLSQADHEQLVLVTNKLVDHAIRIDKIEARLGVVEKEVVVAKTTAAQARETAERAELKADVALEQGGGIELNSTLSFGTRKGIAASEKALGLGFCALGRSGFGGCADLSLGFVGLSDEGPAPTSAVIEIGPRWTIGSTASPLTFDLRALLGFASQTRLSDERYAGMAGGVKAALNFNLSKISSFLPVEVTADAGQAWGMYNNWVYGVKASLDLGAASKLLK